MSPARGASVHSDFETLFAHPRPFFLLRALLVRCSCKAEVDFLPGQIISAGNHLFRSEPPEKLTEEMRAR